MAGHLYIRNITKAQLDDLYGAGGLFNNVIFHYDVTYVAGNTKLVAQENAGALDRAGLPAHCYVEFARNNTDQGRLNGINATLTALSKPAGIVSGHPGLAVWPGANAATTFWNALQRGSIVIEFYQYKGEEVRTAIPSATGESAIPYYVEGLTELLAKVYF